MRLAIVGALSALLCSVLAVGGHPRPAAAWAIDVRVTVYLPTGNPMRSGIYPFSGAAACSPDLSDVSGGEYRTFTMPDGAVYQCLDTGGAVRWRHVDLFAHTWEEAAWLFTRYGGTATIWLD